MVFVESQAPPTRHLWSRYTIEFARRGLALLEGLEVNGPAAPPDDRVWGVARARTRTREDVGLSFVGLRGCADRHDLRGLRVWRRDGWRTVYFPVLRATVLSEELRQLIRGAQADLLGASCLLRIRRASGVPPPRLGEEGLAELEMA